MFGFLIAGAHGWGSIGLGMWVWPDEAYNTPEAKDELIAFSLSKGISHLDQHVGFEYEIKEVADTTSVAEARSVEPPKLQVRFKQAFADLVKDALQQGITVNALMGDPRMFFRERHARTLEELEAIIRFDRELPEGVQLAGVKYDVEPYGTYEWKAGGDSQQQVIVDYLVFLRDAKILLDREAPHLKLSVDVPFWWDNKEFAVKFEGRKKLFSEHIQDRVDYMSIMSYRPTAKQVLECIEGELAYANKIRKPIYAGLETMELQGAEKWISFAEKHPEEFRKEVGILKSKLSRHRGAGLIMLHHYCSLVPYLERLSN